MYNVASTCWRKCPTKSKLKCQGCSSVVQCFPSMLKVLGSISRQQKMNIQDEKGNKNDPAVKVLRNCNMKNRGLRETLLKGLVLLLSLCFWSQLSRLEYYFSQLENLISCNAIFSTDDGLAYLKEKIRPCFVWWSNCYNQVKVMDMKMMNDKCVAWKYHVLMIKL